MGSTAEAIHLHEDEFDLGSYENVVDAIGRTIVRRPMCQGELERTLNRWWPDRVLKARISLQARGKAQILEGYGLHFWIAKPEHCPFRLEEKR